MVQVKSENVKSQLEKLPGILQNEWYNVTRYSDKKDTIMFENFKKLYDNFEGHTIEEFLDIPKVLYTEWENWKYRKGYHTDFKTYIKKYRSNDTKVIEKTLTEVWNEFKKFWQYNFEGTFSDISSKVMFTEMELLSENMIQEWRYKYNFTYTNVYEEYNIKYETYSKKSKAKLWEEFKEIWEIKIDNYNEEKYNKMVKYISKIECDEENYFKEYPRNFYEYCEDGNYHSFDSYSVLEQFEICKDWASSILERYCDENGIESESESDS